jgi:L-amino acid N-acyltransferase YncA
MYQPVAIDRRPASSLADVTLRLGEVHDVEAVEEMHGRCSEKSLHRRFHAPVSRVSARQVRTMLSPTNGWSLVAERRGEVIGFACAAPVSATEIELGMLVEDREQARGLGTRMLHDIAVETAARGYTDLQIYAQPQNERVLAMVQKAGLTGRVSWYDGFLRIAMSVRRLAPTELPQPA